MRQWQEIQEVLWRVNGPVLWAGGFVGKLGSRWRPSGTGILAGHEDWRKGQESNLRMGCPIS